MVWQPFVDEAPQVRSPAHTYMHLVKKLCSDWSHLKRNFLLYNMWGAQLHFNHLAPFIPRIDTNIDGNFVEIVSTLIFFAIYRHEFVRNCVRFDLIPKGISCSTTCGAHNSISTIWDLLPRIDANINGNFGEIVSKLMFFALYLHEFVRNCVRFGLIRKEISCSATCGVHNSISTTWELLRRTDTNIERNFEEIVSNLNSFALYLHEFVKLCIHECASYTLCRSRAACNRCTVN